MKSINRRTFLKLAGAGSAAAAALPVAVGLSTLGSDRLTFKATAGLPSKPLPAYATQIIAGTVDMRQGTGVVTSQVFAGHTEGVSDIALPGLSRVIRVTGAVPHGGKVRLSGVIDDRSTLIKGESSQVEIHIDRAGGIVTAPFMGNNVVMKLAN